MLFKFFVNRFGAQHISLFGHRLFLCNFEFVEVEKKGGLEEG
jgi:hypothetical protein